MQWIRKQLGKRKQDVRVTLQFSQYIKSLAYAQRMSLWAGIKYINDLEINDKRIVKITLVNQA